MMTRMFVALSVLLTVGEVSAQCYRHSLSYSEGAEVPTGSPVGTVRDRWEALNERREDWRSGLLTLQIPHDKPIDFNGSVNPKRYIKKFFYAREVSKPAGDRCSVVGTRTIYAPEQSCLDLRASRIRERDRLREIEARERAQCDEAIARWRRELEEYNRNPPRLEPPPTPQCVLSEPQRLRDIATEEEICNREIAEWRRRLEEYNSEKPACLANEKERKTDLERLKISCEADIVAWRGRIANSDPNIRVPECMSPQSELSRKNEEDVACEKLKRSFNDKFGQVGSEDLPEAPRPPLCMTQDSPRLARLRAEQAACGPIKADWERRLEEYRRNPPRNEPPRPPACMANPPSRPSDRIVIPNCPDVPQVVSRFDWVSYPETTRVISNGAEEDLIEDRPIQVSVKVSGQVLREFESESISLRVDQSAGITATISGSGGSYNTYTIDARTIDSRSAEVIAVGQGRKRGFTDGIRPSLAEMFRQAPSTVTSRGRAAIEMTFDTKIFNPQDDPSMRIKVTYQLLQTDGLHPSHTQFKPYGARTETFDLAQSGPKIQMDLWGSGRGRRVKARIWINIVSSRWYSEGSIETESSVVTVP